MFKNKIQKKITKDINVVEIENFNLENLGIYLPKDFTLSYVQESEVEEIYIAGREMPYHKKVRDLPINLELEFNIKDSNDFYSRIDRIKSYFYESKEKVIRFNNESKGFKIYYVTFGDITRSKERSTIKINLQCYPNLYALN